LLRSFAYGKTPHRDAKWGIETERSGENAKAQALIGNAGAGRAGGVLPMAKLHMGVRYGEENLHDKWENVHH